MRAAIRPFCGPPCLLPRCILPLTLRTYISVKARTEYRREISARLVRVGMARPDRHKVMLANCGPPVWLAKHLADLYEVIVLHSALFYVLMAVDVLGRLPEMERSKPSRGKTGPMQRMYVCINSIAWISRPSAISNIEDNTPRTVALWIGLARHSNLPSKVRERRFAFPPFSRIISERFAVWSTP